MLLTRKRGITIDEPEPNCLARSLRSSISSPDLVILALSDLKDTPTNMPNPSQSPDTFSATENRANQTQIDTVISGQKMLIYSILGYLCSLPILVAANVFFGGTPEYPFVTPMFGIELARGLLGLLGLLAAAICACVGIFRMGGVLFPGSTRYLYAIGVLIPAPLIGLIVMFVANSHATGYLEAHGIKVGFLGAKQ